MIRAFSVFSCMQARDILKLLWENQDELCSIICDIQQASFFKSGKKPDYSMFFVETIYVPPIKFRPPTKGSDSVSSYRDEYILILSLSLFLFLTFICTYRDVYLGFNWVLYPLFCIGQGDISSFYHFCIILIVKCVRLCC